MNPILLGEAERHPDPRVGDVCRITRGGVDFGLWVPFTPLGCRSDGDRTHAHSWLFARFGDPDNHRPFKLSEVVAVEIPCEDPRARSFWKLLEPRRGE